MQTNGDIWIYAEHHGGEIAAVVYELIDKARKLRDAKKAGRICLILPGENVNIIASDIRYAGADCIYVLDHPLLRDYDVNIYVKAIAGMIRKSTPDIVLFGATYEGRELAPALAAKMKTGLTADCVALEIDEGTGLLMQTVPGFGGRMLSTIVCPNKRPQMATVRPGVFNINKNFGMDTHKSASIENVGPDICENDKLTKIISSSNIKNTDTDLKDAAIICAGGVGLKTKENFELLRQFAEAIGGSVGATRAAIDDGLCDEKYMIGQTGSIVSPDIYFAFGISGSIQHVIGIQNCKCMIAINEDYMAPIFDIADYAIVGDAKSVLENMLERKDEILKMLEATSIGAN